MKIFNLSVIIATASVLLNANLAADETIGVLPNSAEAMATAGGRLANLSDPSTARDNPANMTKLSQREWQLNMSLWDGNVNFSSASVDQSVSLMDDIATVGSAFLVNPLSDKLWLGLSLTSPFGLSYDFEEFTPIRYVSPHEALLLTANLSPSIAYKVNDCLSVGVGIDFMYSKLEIDQAFPWAGVTRVPGTPDGEFDFDADGFGVGGYAGVNWEFCKGNRLAFIGRLPIEIEYEGDFRAGGFPAPLAAAGFTSESSFESAIKFPGMVGVGYGVDLTDRLTLGTDFSYYFNSSHDSIPLLIGNNQPLLGGAQGVPLNWEDNYDVGAALSYDLNECLTLRGSYMYSSKSVPDATYNPSVPTNDRHAASVGIGYEKGIHRLDLTYSVLEFPDRTVEGNVQPAFNGDYSYTWQIFHVSYGRKF